MVALDRTVINVEPAGWEEASCGQRHISWKGWIRLIGVGCSMWLVRRAPVALGKGLLGSDKAQQIGLPLPHRDRNEGSHSSLASTRLASSPHAAAA